MANESSDFKRLFLYPALLLGATQAIVALGSAISTGSWKQWYRQIPIWGYALFAAAVLVWIVVVRVRSLRNTDASAVLFARRPLYGWKDIGMLTHANVRWKVLLALSSRYSREDPEDVEVRAPALCPAEFRDSICDTELDEERRFWGGYTWSCVRCGFRISSKRPQHAEAERGTRLAKSEFRSRLQRGTGS